MRHLFQELQLPRTIGRVGEHDPADRRAIDFTIGSKNSLPPALPQCGLDFGLSKHLVPGAVRVEHDGPQILQLVCHKLLPLATPPSKPITGERRGAWCAEKLSVENRRGSATDVPP